MAIRKNDLRRGNDLLFVPRENADEFDAYVGPFGGDMRQSIRSNREENRDDVEWMQIQKVGRGKHGHRRTGQD